MRMTPDFQTNQGFYECRSPQGRPVRPSIPRYHHDHHTTNYAQAYLPKDDPYLINRIVGFLEYAKALEAFDELAALTKLRRDEAIDEIIKSEPEFTVYTNLARRLSKAAAAWPKSPTVP